MNTMIFPLEVGDLTGVILLVVFLMLAPALLFLTIGLILRNRNKKWSKIFFIMAGVYVLIGLGICGGLLGAY